jgi:hypothetical protein
LDQLADVHRGLAAACEALAHHLDVAHSQIEGELTSLVEWTAGIEITGGLLSIVTFGAAEAPTQAVEGARISATAARVAVLVERFLGLARAVADSLAPLADRALEVSSRLRVFLDARLTHAAVTVVGRYRMLRLSGDAGAIGRLGSEAAGFPKFVASAVQLESKFKHATDFAVLLPRGREGFAAFHRALADFVTRPGTTRIYGKLHREPAILNYDRMSRLVVVQRLDGEFWTGWRMSARQLRHVMDDGVLGGH